MTGTGLLAMGIVWVLHFFGYTASLESVQGFAVGLLAFAAVVATFVGQLSRKDLVAGLIRI